MKLASPSGTGSLLICLVQIIGTAAHEIDHAFNLIIAPPHANSPLMVARKCSDFPDGDLVQKCNTCI